ncbi:MAG: class I SAM-dependent methyltransferase [Flavobacteriales bacterium]|nr:class I SAM-dependent methyltransferase [Flavobacteriales bacterium]
MAYAKSTYSPDEVESCDCPLCDNNDFALVHVERESLQVVQCGVCDLIYVNPRLKNPSDNYRGEDQCTAHETATMVFEKKIPHHREQCYRYELDKIKKLNPTGKLLDIGSHCGHFLNIAEEYGYEVTGLEPSTPLSEIARKYYNLNIVTDELDKAAFKEKSFDVVTLIDVFEHITDPKKMLNDISPVLKDDGIICIKVPNGNYNILKLKLAGLIGHKEKYDLFDSYEHVVHYSKKTIYKMAKACGFKVVSIGVPIPIHTPNWPKYVGYSLDYRMPFALDWKRIIIREFFYLMGNLENLLGLPVHFGPDLLFILKKEKKSFTPKE